MRESDLWFGWTAAAADPCALGPALRAAAERLIIDIRGDIESWAVDDPRFLDSLEPLPDDPSAPPVVRAMLRAGLSAGVGPMAAVAGAVAEAVGSALLGRFGLDELVAENGGDLWISVRRPLTVAVYAGLSSLSGQIGIVVPPDICPCGLAASSGTVGPSLSWGKADAAIAIAADAAEADAWATALGNRCRNWGEAEAAVRSLVGPERPEPRGVLVVMGDKLAAAGSVALAPLQKERRRR